MQKILFCLLCLQWIAFADIGKVVAVDGTVHAYRPGHEERSLKKHSPIYLGDRIVTGDDSRVQIKFIDKSLLNLIPNTEYLIDVYQYRKLRQKDQYIGELTQGGFRLLSGSIAKKSPDQYEVKTPTSTIGLRGTIVEVSIISGIVYFGCESGLAIVSNETGSQLIGPSAATQFAIASSLTQTPKPLLSSPFAFKRDLFAAPRGGFDIDKIQHQSNALGTRIPQAAPSRESPSSKTPNATNANRQEIPRTSTGNAPSEQEPEWEFHPTGGSSSVIQSGCG